MSFQKSKSFGIAIDCVYTLVQAHSAKADQNPSLLRTPGILENVPERRAKPNCFCNFMKTISFNWASSQNVPEHSR